MYTYEWIEEKHLSAMADLLVERQKKEQKSFSFLPSIDKDVALSYLTIGNKGLVALREGEVVGYLCFKYNDDFYRGRHVVVDYHSFAISISEHPRLLRLMYAEVGQEWVNNGYFSHLIFSPLGNEDTITQWLDQSFAYNQKYAILPFNQYQAMDKNNVFSFRKVRKGDEELLREIAGWNSIHQSKTPSWNPLTQESLNSVKEGYASLPEDDEAITYLAEEDGEIVGFQVYYRSDIATDLTRPTKCVELSASAVHPEYRGSGIGKALTNYCFQDLMGLGYEHCYLDWHSPNILASNFWPHLGFKPFMARMIRRVDERISWANGEY